MRTRSYEAPQGEIETELAAIWAEVLELERVGRHDNFFELGGHSLLAVQVIARLRQALGVEVPLRELFAQPVLAELARSCGAGAARRSCRPIARGRAERARCRCRLRSSGCGSWRRWRRRARRITSPLGLRLNGAAGSRGAAPGAGPDRGAARGAAHDVCLTWTASRCSGSRRRTRAGLRLVEA